MFLRQAAAFYHSCFAIKLVIAKFIAPYTNVIVVWDGGMYHSKLDLVEMRKMAVSESEFGTYYLLVLAVAINTSYRYFEINGTIS